MNFETMELEAPVEACEIELSSCFDRVFRAVVPDFTPVEFLPLCLFGVRSLPFSA